jgi:hypothetical protein
MSKLLVRMLKGLETKADSTTKAGISLGIKDEAM